MKNEKLKFKKEAGNLVFGTYTINCHKEVQSEYDPFLGKINSSTRQLSDLELLSLNYRYIFYTDVYEVIHRSERKTGHHGEVLIVL